MPQITVGDTSIEVIRKEIKNIHLGVYPPHGRVRIAAPLSFDDESLRLFAVSKMAWVKRQQAKFQSQERQTQREYVPGERRENWPVPKFFFKQRTPQWKNNCVRACSLLL